MSNKNIINIEKYKTITTEIFALTLGLGAFSLATIPKESLSDVVWAITTFAISFFYIVLIWMIHSRFFEE